MTKNNVNDPITNKEMAFARLVLTGTMTDREAAKTAGFHPAAADRIKARPRVRDYILEHRSAVEQQPVQQEPESPQGLNQERERVLARLWEIAYLSPEQTRGSITGQVKAISMIVAIHNLIPSNKKPAPAPQIHAAAWSAGQQPTNPAQQQEGPAKPESHPTSPQKPRPNPDPTGDVIAELARRQPAAAVPGLPVSL